MKEKYNGEETLWSKPSETIECFDCDYRLKGSPIGYRNGFCEKFKTGIGKPSGILWNGEHCKFYKKEV